MNGQRLKLLLDTLSITLAIAAAIATRVLTTPLFGTDKAGVPILVYFPPVPLVVLIWILFYAHSQHYTGNRLDATDKLIIETVKADVMVSLIIVGVAFFQKQADDLARSILPLTVAFNAGLRPTLRAMVRNGTIGLLRPENVAVVGSSPDTLTVARELRLERDGLAFKGLIESANGAAAGDGAAEISRLGDLETLTAIINRHGIDRVVIDEARVDPPSFVTCWRSCAELGVAVEVIPQLSTTILGGVEPIFRNGRMLYQVHPQEARKPAYVVKRAIEWAVAIPLGVIALPCCALIAILIKLEDGGPVLYRQTRIGKGRRYFTVYKFRSMANNAPELREAYRRLNEKTGALFKIEKDPRVTRVGRWLRRYSLDELPQLLNFFKGEMNLVGPRPLPVEDLEALQDNAYQEWVKVRSTVPPGITGYWQVNGRSRLEFKDMIDMDFFYVRNWSVWLDLQILLKTPYAVVKTEGAY